MSWEGYAQCLCVNGHYSLDMDLDKEGCPVCKAPEAWRNVVDDTNCDEYGLIPEADLPLLKGGTTSTCSGCGQAHQCSQPQYAIPDEKVTVALRTYWDETERKRIRIKEGTR